MSKFDSLAIEADKPSRMIIIHPSTREPLGEEDDIAYIDLYSLDSDVARKYNRAMNTRRLQQRKIRRPTPEEFEENAVDLLVALTAGWKLKDLEGVDLAIPFSSEDAKELYSNTATTWIREQVDEFISDRSNFMKPSSRN